MHIIVKRGMGSKAEEKMVLEEGATPMLVMEKLGLHVDSHIAVIEGRPVPVDRVMGDGEELLILAVASGG